MHSDRSAMGGENQWWRLPIYKKISRIWPVGVIDPWLVEFANDPGMGCQTPLGQRLWVARRANQQIPVQPSFKKYSAVLVGQIISTSLRHPVPKRGVGHRHKRWDGMRWTRQRWRETGSQGGFPVSDSRRADERRCGVRQSRVVLAPVAGVKLAEVHEPNRALMSH